MWPSLYPACRCPDQPSIKYRLILPTSRDADGVRRHLSMRPSVSRSEDNSPGARRRLRLPASPGYMKETQPEESLGFLASLVFVVFLLCVFSPLLLSVLTFPLFSLFWLRSSVAFPRVRVRFVSRLFIYL